MSVAFIIFAGTYVVLAIGRLPGFRVDRTGAAIIGATLMIVSGTLSLGEAYAAIDFNTIVLLFGMMIVVANLRLSGFFALTSGWVIKHAHKPIVLLTAIAGVAGTFSAFFVNDTVCLALTPLILDIAGALKRNPVPYLLALAMASNVGSVATITGNPQNIMIASFSGIDYRHFAAALSPVAITGLFVTVGVIAVSYRAEFRSPRSLSIEARPVPVIRAHMWKSLVISVAMIVFFFAGCPAPVVALAAAALLLVTRRIKADRVYREIDWSLLALFTGLFVVVAGVEKTALFAELPELASSLRLENAAVLSACSAALSNIVSNVPAVMVFKPLIPRLADPARAWLTLAMSSTLAGNLTVLGSVANLIVIQRARAKVQIGFWEYFRVGAPLAAITIPIGILFLR